MSSPPQFVKIMQAFNAASLADGNSAAGLNVLASMCFTLANIVPRGAGFLSDDGDLLPVGMNFLMLDCLSGGVADEKIFRQMGTFQTNLSANVDDGTAYDAFHGVGKTMNGNAVPSPPSSDIPAVHLESALGQFGASSRDSSPFELLLENSANTAKKSHSKRHLIYSRLNAQSPPLSKLPSIHLNQPFFRSHIDSGPMQQCAVNRLRVILQGGDGIEAFDPWLALSASPDTLKDIIRGEGREFISKFLWMYDQPHADVECSQSPESEHALTKVFNEALREAWAQRLDFRRTTPPTIKFEWKVRQKNWVAYLSKQEVRFPGISVTAHRLYSTLLFGLVRLSRTESGKPRPALVMSLAKHLVEKMILVREHLLKNEEQARILKIATKLLPKLSEGPLTARQLVRKNNRLNIADCREALQLLQHAGVVNEAENEQWALSMSAPDGVQKIQTLILDV